VSIADGPGNATDWVGLYAQDGSFSDWRYLNGSYTAPSTSSSRTSFSFPMPNAGQYTFIFYASSGALLATSATITVLPAPSYGAWSDYGPCVNGHAARTRNYAVTVNDPTNALAADRQGLLDNLNAAMIDWARYLYTRIGISTEGSC
jgi:hypothetical protein